MRSIPALALLVLGLPLDAEARASDLFPPCTTSFDRLFSDRMFRPYPARVPAYRPRPPNTASGKAHYYRTALWTDARGGANFAGHYTISTAGCGTRTSCIALIDRRTGKVRFPPELRAASRLFVDMAPADYDALHYRLDSNLLILVGSANEQPRTEGVSYYLWRNDKLRLIRRIPIGRLCGWPGGKRP